LLRQLRHGASVQRRTWLLDITTDIGVCPASRPSPAGRTVPVLPSACRAAGARGRGPLGYARNVSTRTGDAVVATKRSERGDDALNAQDRIHLRRAAIVADQCRLLQPVAEYAAHLPIRATEASVIFGLIVERLEKLGIETFCLDLSDSDSPFRWSVCLGLQLEPSEIVTAGCRAIANRGGATYTRGVL
jgi:ribosomal protein S12 methylthiotransferase accessory factor